FEIEHLVLISGGVEICRSWDGLSELLLKQEIVFRLVKEGKAYAGSEEFASECELTERVKEKEMCQKQNYEAELGL
ncbi:7501_t:CDS:2, partial [Cetraspora pellucida]